MNPFKLLKSLALILCTALSLGAQPSHAQGTIPLAMAQQVDINGQPLAGCLLYFYQAGTVNLPQNAFVDFGLTSALPNPVNCDQTGRIPMFWLANGLIHVRLTDVNGLQIIDTTMQVLGPSSGGGGGGGTVDPTTILATGDLKWRLDKTPLSGWVRINGLTIGSATSGATERANADTQPLFIYIWNTFSQPSGNTICPVVGGIGANALADYNASKQITLEDARSRAIFAFDDLGNSALGNFAGVTFTQGSATAIGGKGGANSTTLLPSWIPTITSANTAAIALSVTSTNVAFGSAGAGATGVSLNTANSVNNLSASGQIAIGNAAVTSNNTGGGAFPSVPSFLLGTLFWKL